MRRIRFGQYRALMLMHGHAINGSMSRQGTRLDSACDETQIGSLNGGALARATAHAQYRAKDETMSWRLWHDRD